MRPWPWADTWPIAKLSYRNEVRFVLAGADGTSLAFGPGQLSGSALPGHGHSIIAGHRDTHFAFLEQIAVGDRLRVQLPDGKWHQYRFTTVEVVNSETQPLTLFNDIDVIQLITCYPFATLQTNGPLRLSVIAELESA